MVGTDTSGDTDLEVLCFFEEVGSEITRVERCSDQNFGLVMSQPKLVHERI